MPGDSDIEGTETASWPARNHSAIARLRELAEEPALGSAVEAVREYLGMDVAYATQMSEETQKFRVLRGDGESFGVHEGTELPVTETYCQHVLRGELPNLMPDLREEAIAQNMAITEQAGVGSFASLPLILSDGSIYGTLCAGSHEPTGLKEDQLQFLQVFARMIADQIERDSLERAHAAAARESSVAKALLAAIEARDSYTAEHSQAVVANTEAVGRRIGLGEEELAIACQVALLHDIGKLSISDQILHKPGALDEEELVVMRRHPEAGAKLIEQVDDLAHLAEAIRAEHERWDGDGYPDGLRAEEIPIASRITLVCDAYDAMTTDRPYRRALRPSEARRRIEQGLGSQFCPTAGRALLDHLVGDLAGGFEDD